MVALTQGAKITIEEQLVSLGGNALVVSSGTRTRSGIETPGNAMPLTTQDAEAIKKLSLVTRVTRSQYHGRVFQESQVVHGHRRDLP
jgi:hypothetical protein